MTIMNTITKSMPTVVTIGKFEGLHLGHQKLIHKTREVAGQRHCDALVFSFSPHPLNILRHEPYAPIFTDAEKAFLLEGMGVDTLLMIPFDPEITPEDFARRIVHDLRCCALVAGENFRFGKNRAGDSSLFRAFGADVFELPSECVQGERVSSSRIRSAILENDFAKAQELMGRPYFIRSEIVHGKKLGRELGFPTINMIAEPNKLIPADGVYITETLYQGAAYNSVTNVGSNPTVAGAIKTVETHILGFQDWIYGETAQINFRERLRGEIRFGNLQALQMQLKRDIDKTREFYREKGRSFGK